MNWARDSRHEDPEDFRQQRVPNNTKATTSGCVSAAARITAA